MPCAQTPSYATRTVHATLTTRLTKPPPTQAPHPLYPHTHTHSTHSTRRPIASSHMFTLNPHDTPLKLSPIRSLTFTFFHRLPPTHTLLYTCLSHVHTHTGEYSFFHLIVQKPSTPHIAPGSVPGAGKQACKRFCAG